ncbi:FeoC-like transcriptional regulator [Methylocystis silviterrae]|uniref:FeoC-like transcriptional regulator n=1 Tax=Methylocystis silviterrae TaxID=2743612 RepID=UPI003C73E474
MLLELRDYLASHGWACVRDVAAHFDISPQTAHAMLEHWVRKGKASRFERQCHSCTLPCAKSLVVYQWIDQTAEGTAGVRQ